MNILDPRTWFGGEARNVQDPTKPVSSADFVEWLMGDMFKTAAGINVTYKSALQVPSIFAAVNFLSDTMASVPLHTFRTVKGEKKRQRAQTAYLLSKAANEDTTSFNVRKSIWKSYFLRGRGYIWIDRDPNKNNRPVGLYFLPYDRVTPKMVNNRRIYEFKDANEKIITYQGKDIIDLPFMMDEDGIGHVSPISSNRDSIALAIAATRYGSKFFQNGGVPPFVVTGKFQGEAAMTRAGNDLRDAVKKATKESRLALTLPAGLDIKQLGVDPVKSQMLELHKFLVIEVARIFNLPPTFLHDLTYGTYSNTEQQDIQLVKHTIRPLAVQFEQELNLKLFGFNHQSRFTEHQLNGLMRGSFKDLMEGYSLGVNSGVYMPSEVRSFENLPKEPGSDRLFIQGATVPIDQAGQDAGATND